MTASPIGVAVLISGRGSNLQSLIDGVAAGRLAVRLLGVLSNEPGAAGLARAAGAGITTRVVHHRDFPARDDFDAALAAAVDALSPDLVVLAGFMRVLGEGFVSRFQGRLINIHPSLLPAFPGLNTHRRALDAGVSEHGATVHFVTRKLDGGPAIARSSVAVAIGDDPDTLAARVLEREHRLLPQVVQWFAEGRLTLDASGAVLFDGTRLGAPLEVS